MNIFPLYQQAYNFYKEHSHFQFAAIVQKFLKYDFDAQNHKFVRRKKVNNNRKRTIQLEYPIKVKKRKIEDDEVVVLSSDESLAGSDNESIETISKIKSNVGERTQQLIPDLMSMFPEASPLYIKTLLVHDMCEKNLEDAMLVNNVINHLLQIPYPTVSDPLNLPNVVVPSQDETDEGIDVTENDTETIDLNQHQTIDDTNVKTENVSGVRYFDDNFDFINQFFEEKLKNEYPEDLSNGIVEKNQDHYVLNKVRSATNTNKNSMPVIRVRNLSELTNQENIVSTTAPFENYGVDNVSNQNISTQSIVNTTVNRSNSNSSIISNSSTTSTSSTSSINSTNSTLSTLSTLSSNNTSSTSNSSNLYTSSDPPPVPLLNLDVKQELEIDHNKVNNNMEEEEVDYSDSNTNAIVLKLLPIFPDACPKYLRKICAGKENTPATLEEIITLLIQNDFPKRKQEEPKVEVELDEEEQYEIMRSVLPDADPTFLRYKCSLLINDPEELKRFVNDCIENKGYPTLEEYKRKQQISAQIKDYTTEFNVSKFLELIPNPEEYFSDSKRSYTYIKDVKKRTHTKDILKNLFTHLKMQEILRAVQMNEGKVLKTYHYLETLPHSLKKCRKKGEMPQLYGEPDIPYLQEIAYIIHLKEINEEIKKRAELKRLEFEQAKKLGLLVECNCCYDNELLEVDTSNCPEGHTFCNSCIIKSVEIAFSENKTVFPCLTQCTAEFSLTCLQKILKPKLFSKLALKKQLEEVKAAGVEDLESCPFCEFATIVLPNDKIFKCLNDECMKESCRLCKEPSHIPLRCDEVEKPNEIKARTYIEDKMTEALLRTCWKCGLKFIKEDGCNKMRCSCGALMCYVCGKPVKDYSHFNGQGGTNYHLCPLYNDTEKLHIDAVRKVAEEAKKEIQNKNPNVQLKHDPTRDLPKVAKKDRVYRPGPGFNNVVIPPPHNVNLLNNVQGGYEAPRHNHHRNRHHYHHHHRDHFHGRNDQANFNMITAIEDVLYFRDLVRLINNNNDD